MLCRKTSAPGTTIALRVARCTAATERPDTERRTRRGLRGTAGRTRMELVGRIAAGRAQRTGRRTEKREEHLAPPARTFPIGLQASTRTVVEHRQRSHTADHMEHRHMNLEHCRSARDTVAALQERHMAAEKLHREAAAHKAALEDTVQMEPAVHHTDIHLPRV